MKQLAVAVLLTLVVSVVDLAVPRTAAAGCQCSACQCTRDTTVSLRCRCEGNVCVTGSVGSDCAKCVDCFATADGVISQETEVVAAAPRAVVLTRRSCDGAVVGRQYTTAMAERLRVETRSIRV